MQHYPCELQSVHLSIWKLLNSSARLCETSKCYSVRPCTWLSRVIHGRMCERIFRQKMKLECRQGWNFVFSESWSNDWILTFLCMSGAEIATAILVTTNPSVLECEFHRSSTASISSSFWFTRSQNLSYFGILPLLTCKSLNMPSSTCLIIFCHLSSHCLDWKLSEAPEIAGEKLR